MADPATTRPTRPTRPAGTVRIGRFAGAELYVSASWFVVAALIAVLVAPRVEAVEPGLGAGRYVVGWASRSCSTSPCCCTRARTRWWHVGAATTSARSP